MQRMFRCVSCSKAFRVFNSSESSEDVPDASIAVECPVCRTPNQITWPRGTVYSIVPESRSLTSAVQYARVPHALRSERGSW